MGVHKQSVSFTEAAFEYAKELVDRGDYPNVSAAVSGELARARAVREREQTLLETEVQRRLQVPVDQWEPVTDVTCVFHDMWPPVPRACGQSFHDMWPHP